MSRAYYIVSTALCIVVFAWLAFGFRDANAETMPQVEVDLVVDDAPVVAPAQAQAWLAADLVAPHVPALDGCLDAAPELDRLVVWLETDDEGTPLGLSPGAADELPEGAAACLVSRLGEADGPAHSVAVVLIR